MRRNFTLFIASFAVCLLSISATFAQSETQQIWPLPGTDADLQSPKQIGYSGQLPAPNSAAPTSGWSGGANYTPPGGMPIFSDQRYAPDDTQMPLATINLMNDDGLHTLSASNPPGYPRLKSRANQTVGLTSIEEDSPEKTYVPDMVREWIARDGKQLREILEEWAVLEGWEVIWTTNREYPLQASAVFKGRFTDVASALIRNFGRAAPPPYAKFYYGNRVLVVKTLEDENAD